MMIDVELFERIVGCFIFPTQPYKHQHENNCLFFTHFDAIDPGL